MYILYVMQIVVMTTGSPIYGWSYMGEFTDERSCNETADYLRKFNSNGGVQRFLCRPKTAPKN